MTQIKSAIVNNRKNIFGSFDSIEKSLQFIKTEKEIFNNVNKIIDSLKKRISFINGVQKELKQLIGFEPIKERKYYLGLNEITGEYEEATYLTYDWSSEDKPLLSNEVPLQLTNLIVDVIKKEKTTNEELTISEEKKALMRRYNDNAYNIFKVQERLNYFLKIKANLKENSTQKFTLTTEELERFGF